MGEDQILLENGEIFDGDIPVDHIDWAIPPDTIEKVQAHIEEQGYDIHLYSLDKTAEEYGDTFHEGIDNVIDHPYENFFSEYFKQAGTAATLHSITNAFIVYKGSKEIDEWFGRTVDSTCITAGASGLTMLVEMALRYGQISAGPLSIVTSITARMFLRRIFDRRHFVEWIEDSNNETQKRLFLLDANSSVTI